MSKSKLPNKNKTLKRQKMSKRNNQLTTIMVKRSKSMSKKYKSHKPLNNKSHKNLKILNKALNLVSKKMPKTSLADYCLYTDDLYESN